MALFVILLVATIMALFGIIGFLRVAKSAVISLFTLLGGLAFLRFFGAQMVSTINAAWGFFQEGQKALINWNNVALFYLLVFYLFVVISLGLGALRPFRLQGRFSFSGLFVGLINGYVIATYTLGVILPDYAFLPVPIQVPGMTRLTVAPIPLPGSAAQVRAELLELLKRLANNPAAHVIIAGSIALFILLATRMSGKKG